MDGLKISLPGVFVFFLFYLSPFVDALTGYLVLNEFIAEGAAGSPSQLFRLTVLGLMAVILKNNKSYFLWAAIFIVYITLVEFYFAMFHQSLYGLAIGLVYGSKIVYLLMVFLVLSQLIVRKSLSPIELLKHLRNYVAITAILLVFSFLTGRGFNTYSEGTFGFKGYFPAGNGLGVFMGVGLLASIYYWRVLGGRFSLCLSFIILFGTIIIGSKTAFLFGVLGFLSILFFFRGVITTVITVVVVLIVIGVYFDQIVAVFSKIFDVIIFRYGNSDSVMAWILSNRDNYFLEAIDLVSFDGIFLFRFFIGFGAFVSFRDPFAFHASIDVLESDAADLFFMYGFPIVFLYFCLIVFALYKGLMARNYFIALTFLLLAAHSVMAGHVVFNGMSGVLLPILVLLLNTKRGRLNEKNSIHTYV